MIETIIVVMLFLLILFCLCRFWPLKNFLIWFAFNGPIKSGKLSAYLPGLAIGRRPKKMKGPNK